MTAAIRTRALSTLTVRFMALLKTAVRRTAERSFRSRRPVKKQYSTASVAPETADCPSGGPAGLLNVNGTFYGTTGQGGAENDGTVYSITQSGAETVIHSFAGYPYDGANPRAGLINIKGTLYGATRTAGAQYYVHQGTVFSMTLSGKETILHNFGGRRICVSPTAAFSTLMALSMEQRLEAMVTMYASEALSS